MGQHRRERDMVACSRHDATLQYSVRLPDIDTANLRRLCRVSALLTHAKHTHSSRDHRLSLALYGE